MQSVSPMYFCRFQFSDFYLKYFDLYLLPRHPGYCQLKSPLDLPALQSNQQVLLSDEAIQLAVGKGMELRDEQIFNWREIEQKVTVVYSNNREAFSHYNNVIFTRDLSWLSNDLNVELLVRPCELVCVSKKVSRNNCRNVTVRQLNIQKLYFLCGQEAIVPFRLQNQYDVVKMDANDFLYQDQKRLVSPLVIYCLKQDVEDIRDYMQNFRGEYRVMVASQIKILYFGKSITEKIVSGLQKEFGECLVYWFKEYDSHLLEDYVTDQTMVVAEKEYVMGLRECFEDLNHSNQQIVICEDHFKTQAYAPDDFVYYYLKNADPNLFQQHLELVHDIEEIQDVQDELDLEYLAIATPGQRSCNLVAVASECPMIEEQYPGKFKLIAAESLARRTLVMFKGAERTQTGRQYLKMCDKKDWDLLYTNTPQFIESNSLVVCQGHQFFFLEQQLSGKGGVVLHPIREALKLVLFSDRDYDAFQARLEQLAGQKQAKFVKTCDLDRLEQCIYNSEVHIFYQPRSKRFIQQQYKESGITLEEVKYPAKKELVVTPKVAKRISSQRVLSPEELSSSTFDGKKESLMICSRREFQQINFNLLKNRNVHVVIEDARMAYWLSDCRVFQKKQPALICKKKELLSFSIGKVQEQGVPCYYYNNISEARCMPGVADHRPAVFYVSQSQARNVEEWLEPWNNKQVRVVKDRNDQQKCIIVKKGLSAVALCDLRTKLLSKPYQELETLPQEKGIPGKAVIYYGQPEIATKIKKNTNAVFVGDNDSERTPSKVDSIVRQDEEQILLVKKEAMSTKSQIINENNLHSQPRLTAGSHKKQPKKQAAFQSEAPELGSARNIKQKVSIAVRLEELKKRNQSQIAEVVEQDRVSVIQLKRHQSTEQQQVPKLKKEQSMVGLQSKSDCLSRVSLVRAKKALVWHSDPEFSPILQELCEKRPTQVQPVSKISSNVFLFIRKDQIQKYLATNANNPIYVLAEEGSDLDEVFRRDRRIHAVSTRPSKLAQVLESNLQSDKACFNTAEGTAYAYLKLVLYRANDSQLQLVRERFRKRSEVVGVQNCTELAKELDQHLRSWVLCRKEHAQQPILCSQQHCTSKTSRVFVLAEQPAAEVGLLQRSSVGGVCRSHSQFVEHVEKHLGGRDRVELVKPLQPFKNTVMVLNPEGDDVLSDLCVTLSDLPGLKVSQVVSKYKIRPQCLLISSHKSLPLVMSLAKSHPQVQHVCLHPTPSMLEGRVGENVVLVTNKKSSVVQLIEEQSGAGSPPADVVRKASLLTVVFTSAKQYMLKPRRQRFGERVSYLSLGEFGLENFALGVAPCLVILDSSASQMQQYLKDWGSPAYFAIFGPKRKSEFQSVQNFLGYLEYSSNLQQAIAKCLLPRLDSQQLVRQQFGEQHTAIALFEGTSLTYENYLELANKKRAVSTKYVKSSEEVAGCSVVILPESRLRKQLKELNKLRHKPILLVESKYPTDLYNLTQEYRRFCAASNSVSRLLQIVSQDQPAKTLSPGTPLVKPWLRLNFREPRVVLLKPRAGQAQRYQQLLGYAVKVCNRPITVEVIAKQHNVVVIGNHESKAELAKLADKLDNSVRIIVVCQTPESMKAEFSRVRVLAMVAASCEEAAEEAKLYIESSEPKTNRHRFA